MSNAIMINHHLKSRRVVSVLLAALFIVTLMVPTAVPVSAANRRFITEITVVAGAEAVDVLEADGWSVMMVGLNVTADPEAQVYLAYKMNTGAPVTNVILSPDVGDSLTDNNGIVYTCVSHVDVDEGIEGSAGCLYATRDERAGAPLVSLDVMRGSTEDDKVLYTISNDGAEIVRTKDGKPADLENANANGVVYLFQIRDGIVRPYIKEIGIVTDTDKWNAVYTAAERGYNYFVEGDVDDSSDTYTIIAYERTADPKDAITSIVAVSAETVKSLEDAQIVDGKTENGERATAAAITISGAEYVRTSSKPIGAKEPYYLYRTKDAKAGNPVSMLYAEAPEQTQTFLFGTWANSYFFSPGATTAYSYCMNEDIYMDLWEDQTVCCKLPVRLLDSYESVKIAEPSTETQPAETQPAETQPAETQPAETQPAEAQPAETQPAETQPSETQSTETQPAETQPSETPSAEEPTTDTSATEEPTAEPSNTETPTTETQSEETQPEETQPEETQPEETQPEETQPEETQPEETQPEETQPEETQPEKTPATEPPAAEGKYVNLTMLTPRDGLPESAGLITGVNYHPLNPYSERTERSDRNNKYQASVFGKGGIYALIIGGVLILGAVVAIIIKKRSGKNDLKSKNKSKSAKQKGRR